MKAIRLLLVSALWIVSFSQVRAADELPVRIWQVDGVTREALLHTPPTAAAVPAPVIFVFHGFAGFMNQAADTFDYHTRWPEAIVVYMQGLDSPGMRRGSKVQKPGWQRDVGVLDDRDLKFFDAVMASLSQDYKVDEKRVYAAGHGSGGAFTYVLWAARGQRFAAMAPSSTIAGLAQLNELKPKPVLHLAGENDSLAKFDWQKLTMEGLRKLNRCGEGRPWENCCTLYPSDIGAPVVTYIHPGRHEFPTNAAAVIVKFFKEHAQP